jgi:hypothetical protein
LKTYKRRAKTVEINIIQLPRKRKEMGLCKHIDARCGRSAQRISLSARSYTLPKLSDPQIFTYKPF